MLDDLKEIHELVCKLNVKIMAFDKDRLREIREAAGLSGDKLGELMGMTGVSIHHYEQGTTKISANHLDKMYLALMEYRSRIAKTWGFPESNHLSE